LSKRLALIGVAVAALATPGPMQAKAIRSNWLRIAPVGVTHGQTQRTFPDGFVMTTLNVSPGEGSGARWKKQAPLAVY